MDKLFDRSRIGRFYIPMQTLEQGIFPVICAALGMTIIRAEYMYHKDGVEYISVCPSFEKVPEGAVEPDYDIIVKQKSDGELSYRVNKK
jgi:hypothetical protein